MAWQQATQGRAGWRVLALALACAASGLASGNARAQANVQIALLPVLVHSSEDPTYLRDGLSDMLVSRLDQAGVFRVHRIDDPEVATVRVSEAIATGKRLGVDYVLFGSFTRFGQGASLDMQCVAVHAGEGSEPLREIFVHSGNIGDVIPDLDDLVGKVARFAVAGYQQPEAGRSPAAVSNAPPPSARNTAVRELEERLESLERAVEELQIQALDQ